VGQKDTAGLSLGLMVEIWRMRYMRKRKASKRGKNEAEEMEMTADRD